MTDLRKAALIEIDGSHDECLYSQLLFLKEGGFHTTLVCSDNLSRQVHEFNASDELVFFSFGGKSTLDKLKELWKLRNYLIVNNITTVILNSTHGSLIRNFCLLPFPSQTRFYGTLHGINKLKRSFTQNLISTRVKHYFLLNDYLKDNLKQVPHRGLSFESFYPIFFLQFHTASEITKPADEFWIGIPGQVEYKRRDYETLVKAFAAVENKPNYRFLLLGKSEHKEGNGVALQQLIKDNGVTEYFVFWKGFMENSVFHAYLQQCDIIMPLIHPGNDGFEKYLVYQITGSYNLAFAYKKPLLMLEDFSRYADFKENGIFYSLDNLSATMTDLPKAVETITPRLYKDPKWQFQAQCKRYLDFIGR